MKLTIRITKQENEQRYKWEVINHTTEQTTIFKSRSNLLTGNTRNRINEFLKQNI